MDEGWRALERLHQIGCERVLQQRRHRALGFQLAGANGFAVPRVTDHDAREPLLQILEIGGETEDRHHLGSHRDVESVLARETVGDAAQRRDDLAQRPVVHVHHAAPHHPARIEAERVAPIDVIVQHRGEEIVGRGNGMEVAREMEVDVLHRDDLRIPAACCAALHAERRTQRRLAQAKHRSWSCLRPRASA